jgi:hypothetical protein
MIRIDFEGLACCPMLVCDVCGEQLKAGMGLYTFLPPGDGGSSKAYLVCEGECNRTLQQKIGRTWSGGIPDLLGFLISNAGTTHRKAKAAADLFDARVWG